MFSGAPPRGPFMLCCFAYATRSTFDHVFIGSLKRACELGDGSLRAILRLRNLSAIGDSVPGLVSGSVRTKFRLVRAKASSISMLDSVKLDTSDAFDKVRCLGREAILLLKFQEMSVSP